MGRVQQRPLYVVAGFGLLLFLLAALLYLQGSLAEADANSCKRIYMYPSYARIKSFDNTHTKFASKYSLYLYREQGLDPIPSAVGDGFDQLTGIPVLFIPGNAGSYRQVRSIAAECSILHFDQNINVVENDQTRNLDFFAADFNEDFTAFHGRTLLDQAEYVNEAVRFILGLYSQQPNPPKSVLILAHSMGGIVARVMPTLQSYSPGSISSIVTLSSPHSAAPLTFDADVLKIYLAIDRFWYQAFNEFGSGPYKLISNVTLISITGGASDSVLPADYTALGYLLRSSHGFTVYTTGIPGVWTPMDHLAIVWCRQLRRSILKALLEAVDFSSPQRVHSVERQMAVFRKNLLSGFERYARQDLVVNSAKASGFNLKLGAEDLAVVDTPFCWKSQRKTKPFTFLAWKGQLTVHVLSLGLLPRIQDFDSRTTHSVLLCKKGGSNMEHIDFTTLKTTQSVDLHCVDVSADLKQIPRSAPDARTLEDSAFDGDAKPFHALQYTSEDLSPYDGILIIDKRANSEDFLMVQTSNPRESSVKIGLSLKSLLWRGAHISFPGGRPLAININLPGAWSSIIALRVKAKQNSGTSFLPFIRQWIEEPYETKWHINLDKQIDLSVAFHGVAPYTPFGIGKLHQGLNLELWAEPLDDVSAEHDSAITFAVQVDWLSSAKLLALRYRLAIVSHCLAVALLVTFYQFSQAFSHGKFPDYAQGLARITDKNIFIVVVLFLSVLTPLVKLKSVQSLLDLVDPVVLQDRDEVNISLSRLYRLNSFYLGLEETCLFFLGPMFYVMAIGINFTIYHILVLISTSIKHATKLSFWKRVTPKPAINTATTCETQKIRKKIVTCAVLLLLIPIYVPYQFAFIVCFAIQVSNCIKMAWVNASQSVQNFNFSMLMAMVWILPINIPVLIVFVHNFNVSWSTPFSSHHNFLAVAPILAVTEISSYYGAALPLEDVLQGSKKWIRQGFALIMSYTIFYSMIYGTRHTYWLHHLFNFLCSWVVIMFISLFTKDRQQEKSK